MRHNSLWSLLHGFTVWMMWGTRQNRMLHVEGKEEDIPESEKPAESVAHPRHKGRKAVAGVSRLLGSRSQSSLLVWQSLPAWQLGLRPMFDLESCRELSMFSDRVCIGYSK